MLSSRTLLGHGRWRTDGDWETGLGVDLAVANALSWRFEVDVRRGGRRQSFTCRRGRIEHPLADHGPAKRSGNRFALVLDVLRLLRPRLRRLMGA